MTACNARGIEPNGRTEREIISAHHLNQVEMNIQSAYHLSDVYPEFESIAFVVLSQTVENLDKEKTVYKAQLVGFIDASSYKANLSHAFLMN
jgi:hypothetical protein